MDKRNYLKHEKLTWTLAKAIADQLKIPKDSSLVEEILEDDNPSSLLVQIENYVWSELTRHEKVVRFPSETNDDLEKQNDDLEKQQALSDDLIHKAVDHFIKIMDGVEQQHKRIADTFERIAENIEPFFDPDEGLSDLEPDSDDDLEDLIFEVGDRVKVVRNPFEVELKQYAWKEIPSSWRTGSKGTVQKIRRRGLEIQYDDGPIGTVFPECLELLPFKEDLDKPKKKKSKRPELDIFQVGDRVEVQESGRWATIAKAQSSSAGTIHIRYDDGTSGKAWPESLMHVRPAEECPDGFFSPDDDLDPDDDPMDV